MKIRRLFNIHDIPETILDYWEILEKSFEHLQFQFNFQPVAYNLLPLRFTMPELQSLYEIVLDRKLERRIFQRKIVGSGILERLNETKKGVGTKPRFIINLNCINTKNRLKSEWVLESDFLYR